MQREALDADTGKHSSTLETAVPSSTESVNEGHPNKICDQFSDVVLDACLTCDTKCKVASETCVKDNMFMVTGEITVAGKLHHENVVRGVAQREAHMNRMVQKTIEIPQLRQTDQVIDVPVVLVVQVLWVQVVAETVEIPVFLSDVRGVVQNIGIDSFTDDLSNADSRRLSHQDCEGLFQVGKQSTDISGVVHVDRDDLHAMLTAEGTQQPHGSKQHHGSQQQQATNKQRQQTGRTEEEEKENEEGEEKERDEREKEERERRKGERGKEEEGRDAEEEERKQVEKDVTGWTVVTRNKRQKKMVQIFVKVDEAKVTPMEVSLTDGKVEDVMRQIQKDEDVYVTMHGKVLRRNEKLKSCGVTDGCTIQVMSRMRGGGRHKGKKSKSEKTQITHQERPEQKRDGESRSDEGPEMMPMDEALRRLIENEEYQKFIEYASEGGEGKVQQKAQNYLACMQKVSWMNKEQFEHLESGVWQAVEARRKGWDEQQEQWRQAEQGKKTEQEQSKQGKQVRFGEEQQLWKTGAENAGESEVMGSTTEVRTGRGSAGLVRGRDERCRADETRKGNGKGNGGKGEHEGKGGAGSKGRQQVENSLMDEDEGNTGAMRSEEEEENHREDVRK